MQSFCGLVFSSGCYAAETFIKRFLGDAVQAEGLNAAARSRLPANPPDLMLRMLNVMVDSYLDLRKELSADPAEAARLEQEARFAAAVNHPNVVQVYSAGSAGGRGRWPSSPWSRS